MGRRHKKIVCIGSVLWDIIGTADITLLRASDVAGNIKSHPGGVAFNIARQLSSLGFNSIILTALGQDKEGEVLEKACQEIGLDTQYIYWLKDRSTDRYMAIEDAEGVVAAIADAFTLEAAGDRILRALKDGSLGSENIPFEDIVILDGNLSTPVLMEISESAALSACDLRLCPASPSKVKRLTPFLDHKNATFYCNFQEAEVLCNSNFIDTEAAVTGLLNLGVKRAIVTNGNGSVCDGWGTRKTVSCKPPKIAAKKVTGAGDTFMATHLAAELKEYSQKKALAIAVDAAASYVAGKETS